VKAVSLPMLDSLEFTKFLDRQVCVRLSGNWAVVQCSSKPKISFPYSMSCPVPLYFRVLLVQFVSDLKCEIGQYAIASSPLECEKAFHHDPFSVNPSIGGSSLDHRILAGNLIGESGH